MDGWWRAGFKRAMQKNGGDEYFVAKTDSAETQRRRGVLSFFSGEGVFSGRYSCFTAVLSENFQVLSEYYCLISYAHSKNEGLAWLFELSLERARKLCNHHILHTYSSLPSNFLAKIVR